MGVITVLDQETRAVHDVLGLQRVKAGELPFFEGTVDVWDMIARVATIRALAQGPRSTVVALDHLRRHYDPAVIVLTGIASGIHPDIALGDVVVATHVVHYELRKEIPGGRPRGQKRESSSAVGDAVDSFFTDWWGEPARLPDADDVLRVHAGPIGSGDAIIDDAMSGNLEELKAFNDKILAVGLEARGLVEAYDVPEGPAVRERVGDRVRDLRSRRSQKE